MTQTKKGMLTSSQECCYIAGGGGVVVCVVLVYKTNHRWPRGKWADKKCL